jgi:hypothetical protein
MPKQAARGGTALVILAILIGGCAQPAPETESPEATEEIQVETEQPTPEPTDTARPTNTPRPTATRTPRPTRTPSPTATPEPATNTPQPAEPTTQVSTEEPAQEEPTAEGPTQEEPTQEEPTQEEPTQEEPVEFVPAGASVWVLDNAPSETGSSEACPAPFFADFYGLVAVETIDNGITWLRAQDGITYTLQRQSPNVYWGSGESIYPGYTLNITVVFTSPTALGATFELLDQAVEGCTHYWKYGGVPR